jgi:DHA1 family tetracycline resistance protein-like MFS transporter
LRRYSGVLGLTTVVVSWNAAMQALVSTWVLSNSYRFSWSAGQQGVSLALFGLMFAVVQVGLLRFLIERLGERRVLVLGLLNSVAGFVLYGAATEGWMMYAILVATALSAVTQPAAQGLISNQVRDDEQGAIQGALVSLFSLAGIVSPLIATTLFSYFTAPERPAKVPGAPFFFCAAVTFLALALALGMFARAREGRRAAVIGS